jgi:hypothetical protein
LGAEWGGQARNKKGVKWTQPRNVLKRVKGAQPLKKQFPLPRRGEAGIHGEGEIVF